LAIKEREFGPDHLEVASPLVNLATAWSDLGQPGKTRDLNERALAIKEREFGPDHLEVAGILVNLGNAWSALGQPAKAHELYERALAIEEREFGPDHPQVAGILVNLGTAWSDLGQLGEARKFYERCASFAPTFRTDTHTLISPSGSSVLPHPTWSSSMMGASLIPSAAISGLPL
jgi:tetratricopeptide (TPR) repeat protein